MAYETTKVPVERSQAQLRKLLQQHGAGSFEFGEGRVNGQQMAAIAFAVHGYRVRMRAPLKLPTDQEVREVARRRKGTADDARAAAIEQEAKRIWRVLAWNVKARMEAVEEGVETFEEAFLAHLLNEETGQTIYEQLTQIGRVDLGGPLRPALEAGE